MRLREQSAFPYHPNRRPILVYNDAERLLQGFGFLGGVVVTDVMRAVYDPATRLATRRYREQTPDEIASRRLTVLAKLTLGQSTEFIARSIAGAEQRSVDNLGETRRDVAMILTKLDVANRASVFPQALAAGYVAIPQGHYGDPDMFPMSPMDEEIVGRMGSGEQMKQVARAIGRSQDTVEGRIRLMSGRIGNFVSTAMCVTAGYITRPNVFSLPSAGVLTADSDPATILAESPDTLYE